MRHPLPKPLILKPIIPIESRPTPSFPCLTDGNRYHGCIGTGRCRTKVLTPKCLFGRWSSERWGAGDRL